MAEGKERYAIVRVDDYRCVKALERIKWNCGCFKSCGACQKNYGDTKEQLVKKIMTAFKIAINENKKGNIQKENSNRQVAEIVAEYLGVK